jgi:hypothetical protein
LITIHLSRRSLPPERTYAGIAISFAMALEGFAALGLAANIAQFVKFASKMIVGTYEAYISVEGFSKEDTNLEQLTTSLSQFSDGLELQLTTSQPTNSLIELGLQKLAKDCKAESAELLKTLQRLKLKPADRKWKGVSHCLLRTWKEGDIRALERRLDRYRNELSIHLIGILRYFLVHNSEIPEN